MGALLIWYTHFLNPQNYDSKIFATAFYSFFIDTSIGWQFKYVFGLHKINQDVCFGITFSKLGQSILMWIYILWILVVWYVGSSWKLSKRVNYWYEEMRLNAHMGALKLSLQRNNMFWFDVTVVNHHFKNVAVWRRKTVSRCWQMSISCRHLKREDDVAI